MRQFPASPITELIDSSPQYNLGESYAPHLSVADILEPAEVAGLSLGYGTSAGDAKCDTEFAASGECTAAPDQFQSVTGHEGIRLIGPAASDSNATSWSVNITWVAEYPH